MAIVFPREWLARESFAKELLGFFLAIFAVLLTMLVLMSRKRSPSTATPAATPAAACRPQKSRGHYALQPSRSTAACAAQVLTDRPDMAAPASATAAAPAAIPEESEEETPPTFSTD